MPLQDTRAEYDRRMHRVFEHIDRHLDQPLDLATLAAVAHFSPFHFHRLFTAWMGETLGDYLRRRRVEVAAMRLLTQPRMRVLEAALAVGFGSGEAFTRAFRLHFGAAPSTWRRQARDDENRNPGQAGRKADQAGGSAVVEDAASRPPPAEAPMQVTVIERAAVRVAYLRHTGPYGEPIARFYQTDVQPWLVAHGWLGRERYGVSHDDPGVTAPAQCRYDACVELTAEDTLPRHMLTTTLPAGRYAVMYAEGTGATIGAAWQRLLRDWLPDSGWQLDARPCFEHYPQGSRYDARSGVFTCSICIPVAPL